MEILSYVKNAMALLGRGEVVNTADLMDKLQENTDTLADLKVKLDVLRKVNTSKIDKKQLQEAQTYMNIAGINARDFRSGVLAILETVNNVAEASKRLMDIIGSLDEKKFMMKTLTPKQSAIILYGQRITNATELLKQLTLLVVYTTLDDSFIYKARKNEFISTAKQESLVILQFNRKAIKETVTRIKSLSDSAENTNNPTLTDKLFKLPGKNNFTGNPIFHIRRWWLDKQFETYEKNKAEKKLLELKLAELKIKVNGDDVPLNIQEQIEYYEEQIQKYDRKIEEFRNDI